MLAQQALYMSMVILFCFLEVEVTLQNRADTAWNRTGVHYSDLGSVYSARI